MSDFDADRALRDRALRVAREHADKLTGEPMTMLEAMARLKAALWLFAAAFSVQVRWRAGAIICLDRAVKATSRAVEYRDK